MKEASDYKYYSARLRRPLFLLAPGRLWAKGITRDEYTDYSRKWLVRRFGDQWPKKLEDSRYSEAFEIYGRDSKETDWEPLSAWVIRHNNRTELMYRNFVAEREVAEREAQRRRPGRPAGSGIGILVRHLRDVERLDDYDELLWVLQQSKLAWVTAALEPLGMHARKKLPEWFSANRRPHGKRCSYCTQGLPSEVKAALALRKNLGIH